MASKEKMSVEIVEKLKKLSPKDRKELHYKLLDHFVGDLNTLRYIDCLFTMAERG